MYLPLQVSSKLSVEFFLSLKNEEEAAKKAAEELAAKKTG